MTPGIRPGPLRSNSRSVISPHARGQEASLAARKRGGEGVQNKRSKAGNDTATLTCISPSIESSSADASPARELVHSEQHKRVTVYTQFSENNKILSWTAESVRRRSVIHGGDHSQLFASPHPLLPTKVPFHLKQVFSECNRAAKMAWIAESGLAEFPDEDLSDEHLGKLYKAACWKLARHQKNPQATSPHVS